MTDRLWGGVGVGEPLIPRVTWQSRPQLSLEVSYLQTEFVSPSSPYAGGHAEANSSCYEPYKSGNVPLSCRSLKMPGAWCPGDDRAEQCKAGEDNKLRRGEQELFVIG